MSERHIHYTQTSLLVHNGTCHY